MSDPAEWAANERRLATCPAPFHHFTWNPGEQRGATCESCRGTISRASVRWYREGRLAAERAGARLEPLPEQREANETRLACCPASRHTFRMAEAATGRFYCICTHCGGEMSAEAGAAYAEAYDLGRAAALSEAR